MRLQRGSRISLISVLSFLLFSCAGTAPKLEHPVKFWNGTPERSAVCRTSSKKVIAFVQRELITDTARQQAATAIREALARDQVECVAADSEAFGGFVALTFEDIGALLRFQENLLFKCEKWAK